MTTNFWKELPKPFFVLAPMEDVTDVVFRHVVKQQHRMSSLLSLQTQTVSVIQMEKIVYEED